MMETSFHITASYAFRIIPEADLPQLKQELMTFGKDRKMQGLVLIATEGINSTVAGTADAIGEWKTELKRRFGAIVFKDSAATGKIFTRWSVKIKPEIVMINNPNVRPGGHHKHLSPAEFHAALQDDVVVIDARNKYEVAIGAFKNAVNPNLRTFQEFPAFVAQANIPKDKKVLMYCTGGIRCEKALLGMEAAGYENVYQLEGGILAYLEQFPNEAFQGECFVFDHRAAVDQHLQPSRIYSFCPHCGDPGSIEIACRCGTSKKICERCAQTSAKNTCSKRCANEAAKVAVQQL